MITVCNTYNMPSASMDKDSSIIYIGRGTPVGNPFKMYNGADRDRVCDNYNIWFYNQIKHKNEAVIKFLDNLKKFHKLGDLYLRCYCAPKRCHGDTIKSYLKNS
jgi:hypothetical protein